MSNSDKQFIKAVRDRLEQSLLNLSPELDSRLNQMRADALHSEFSKIQNKEATAMLADASGSLMDDPQVIGSEIEEKLNLIRKQAIAQLEGNSATREALLPRLSARFVQLISIITSALPKPAFATACVLLSAVSLFYYIDSGVTDIPIDSAQELIASVEDIELYENLDFYLWLAENDFPN